MKLLVMCEGPNELAIINMLLNENRLIFSNEDLLNLVPFHARQIDKSTAVKTALNLYPREVKVLRIGDKMNDCLRIPKDYRDKIISIEKYCTKPELEMLFIIAENLVEQFNKVKSKVKPKDFCKSNIIYNRKNYDNSTKFYYDYFSNNVDLLVYCIERYYQIHKTHSYDEHYLSELLK